VPRELSLDETELLESARAAERSLFADEMPVARKTGRLIWRGCPTAIDNREKLC